MVIRNLPPRRSILFAGRRWWVKQAGDPVGPGPNRFDDSSGTVEVDSGGNLVLRVRRLGGRWVCAEVIGVEPTGYGRFEWAVRTDLTSLDHNVVCGMFTWSDDPDHHHREIDVEVSAWGRAAGVAGQFVVQPAGQPGHLRSFALKAGSAWRCSLDWSRDRVAFMATSASGNDTWSFAGNGVPEPGGAHPRINLWLYRGVAPRHPRATVVTFSGFTFTPAPG